MTTSTLRFLFFVAVAAVFWLLHALNDVYETRVNATLAVVDVPEDYVITDEPARDISIKVRGRGIDLAWYNLRRMLNSTKAEDIRLPFEHNRANGNHFVGETSQIVSSSKMPLPAAVEIVGVTPERTEYYYCSYSEQKQVPVSLRLTLNTADAFAIDTIVKPQTVTAFAPTRLLATIKSARTHKVNITQAADTISRLVRLSKIAGVKFVPDIVQLQIPIDMMTEKVVEVPVHGINVPRGMALRCFPNHVQLRFQVPLHKYAQIEADDFEVTIDCVQLSAESSAMPSIARKPQDVRYVRIEPAGVDYVLEKQY